MYKFRIFNFKSVIQKNIFSLSFIQIANYLLPLITIPYVVRIIGPDNLGIINLAQALIGNLIIIVNFGFDFTATREISIHRNNKKVVNEIFNATLFAKLILFFLTTIIFFVLINIDAYNKYSLVIFYTYIVVFANVLFPTWYFQGTEQLTKTAIVNFLSRFLTLVLTFVCIQNAEDYALYPLIISMGQFIFNSLSLVYVVKVSKIVLALPRISQIIKAIKDGVSIFISTIVINFYQAGGVIILGLFATNEAVGYFSAASKIIVLFQSIILYPLYQSLFPHLSKSFDIKIDEGLRVLRKMLFWVIGVTSAGSVVLFFGANLIILIIYGEKFLPAVICLRVVSVLLIIIGIRDVLGVQGLINMKKDKIFMIITGTGALFSILLYVYFSSNFQELGTSIAWVITETIVMIGFIYSYYRLKLRLFKPDYKK